MNIINVKVDDLKPYENNPRFNDDAVEYVAKSIKDFGFKVPLVIDKNNVIVAGHTRYKASIELGLKEVPCIVADDLNEKQIKLFRLADNKVSENSLWDYELLDEEIEKIINIDLEKYGFLVDSDAVDFVDRMMGQGVGGSSYETELDNITISFEKEYEEEIKEVIADVGKQEIVDRVIEKIKES